MKRLKPTHFPLRRPTAKVLMRIYEALFRHYGPLHWWPGETSFEVMVGAILTQNTAWTNVEKAIKNLKQSNLLNARRMLETPDEKLAQFIRPAGYFNIKSKRLKNFLKFFYGRYNANVKKMFKSTLSRLRDELLQINGIGEETADSILLYAGNKASFVVDAYTRRVLTRHRYIKGGEKYGEIQSLFTKHLKPNPPLYNEYHAQIVAVGKDFCRKTPDCQSCPLARFL